MFGIRLKELRIERGLTQKKLAVILDCDQSMVSLWENAICEPTESIIRATAIYFGVSADYLIGLSDY